MIRGRNIAIAVVVILVVIVASGVPYTVGQTQNAVVLEFGKLQRIERAAGLHFKVPFVEQVRRYSNQVLSLDASPQHYTTQDGDDISVDYFVKWRIKDLKRFYAAFDGSQAHARAELADAAGKGLEKRVSKRTLIDLVTEDDGATAASVLKTLQQKFSGKGVQVLDMRVRRINLPDSVSQSIYGRMKSSEEQQAKQIRAQGAEKAETIRAKARSQRAEILAEAYRKAQAIRGDGDAQAAAIYARAYRQAPDFYRFYRSLQIYRQGWSNKRDWLLLGSHSPLFSFFNNPSGKH